MHKKQHVMILIRIHVEWLTDQRQMSFNQKCFLFIFPLVAMAPLSSDTECILKNLSPWRKRFLFGTVGMAAQKERYVIILIRTRQEWLTGQSLMSLDEKDGCRLHKVILLL